VAELNRKLNGQIKFIGINGGINEKSEKVREFVRKNHIDFAVVFDADQRMKKGMVAFRGTEMPEDVETRTKQLLN
jgi:hypothetical protein